MKSFKQLFLIALICNSVILFAQQKVALHSNGLTTIYGGPNPFADAYNASTTGDTLYLPGGNISHPTNIDKGLFIIGAGFYPDSTTTTSPTILTGNLTISQNADNLHLEGFELTGQLSFSSNHKVDDVNIKRCKVAGINYAGSRTTPCENNVISECVITGDLYLINAKNSILSNSIIVGQILNALNMGISNNLLLYNMNNSSGGYITFDNIDASLINNNIIFRTYPNNVYRNSTSNTFQNNVFAIVPTIGLNTFTDNYNSVDFATLFVNQSGYIFNYLHDYNLVNPTTYLGTDGLQVGLYGGFYPYKKSSVPINPHFQFKNIAPQTNSNGDLNIQIKVEAQDN